MPGASWQRLNCCMTSNASKSIILIGYRGTGKSAVARQLASRLGWTAVDADEEIERRACKPIADIFAEDGEISFRELETEVVADLCARSRHVIALGGGAVVRQQNRDTILASSATVVWLTASVATIAARLAADTATSRRRPPLTSLGVQAEIEALLAERAPIYQQCATFVVDTDHGSPADVADQIVANL
jgi:shikimate kinase